MGTCVRKVDGGGMKQQDMTVDEALLVADQYGNYSTSSTPGVRALVLLSAEVRRQHAEIESFCMEYRMKCDAETKAQAVEIERLSAALKAANSQAEHFEREWYLRGDEIECLHSAYFHSQQQFVDAAADLKRLQAQLDASCRDAERAAGTASKLADQRLTTRVEADIETQRWQAMVNAEIESAYSNRVPTAADETRLRDFIDATVGVKP